MTAITTTLNQHANAIRKLGRQTIEGIIEIGRRLTECKALVKETDESWGDWLKREFEWSHDSASRFIRAYEMAKSENRNLRNADLPVSALYLLVQPSTSKETRENILARAAKGEKIKHREVATAVRKTKSTTKKERRPVETDIINAVQNAGTKGHITDELKVLFAGKYDPQTVNSTTNALFKADELRDSGERRQGRAKGGRAAIVYVYNPNPQPKSTSTGKKPGKVVDLNERRFDDRLASMIDDNSIGPHIAKWGKGKSEKERGKKAWRLVWSLVGEGRSIRNDLSLFIRESKFGGAFADEQWAVYEELNPGKKISFDLKLK